MSLVHQSHSLWPSIANRGKTSARPTSQKQFQIPEASIRTPGRQITLDWDGKQRPKRLARRVMILGAEHPSTLRLYGQGLAPCDHAVVCVGDSVWTINLNPNSIECDPRSLCKPLNSVPSYETIGNIKLRLGVTQQAPKTPESSASHPGQPAISLHLSNPPRTESTPKSEKDRQNKSGEGPRSTSEPSATSTGTNKSRDGSKPIKQSPEADPNTPETLTTQLTDQLVRIDQAKFTKRRSLVIFAIIAGFLTAVAIVLWIVFELLVPKMSEMMG
ncbi:MAG: hypothetical protein P8L85_06240 [Rubripirellula sp.]|nr:hypothetical protein [Rubripirellula sp.]